MVAQSEFKPTKFLVGLVIATVMCILASFGVMGATDQVHLALGLFLLAIFLVCVIMLIIENTNTNQVKFTRQ